MSFVLTIQQNETQENGSVREYRNQSEIGAVLDRNECQNSRFANGEQNQNDVVVRPSGP